MQQDWDWGNLPSACWSLCRNELLKELVSLLEDGVLHIFGHSEEQDLSAEAIRRSGLQGWELIMSSLERRSLLRMDLDSWLLGVLPSDEIIGWIGDDLARAKLVASLVGIKDGPPNRVIRHLLGRFGDDADVSLSLANGFVTGHWSINDSEHLGQQIKQLKEWIQSPREQADIDLAAHWVLGRRRRSC